MIQMKIRKTSSIFSSRVIELLMASIGTVACFRIDIILVPTLTIADVREHSGQERSNDRASLLILKPGFISRQIRV